MKLRHMFPRQSLDAEDLRAYNPGVTVVTIEQIDYKTLAGDRIGEAEIAYYLKVREFKKPFKLNKTVGGQLEALFGTDETDEWIGRVIGIVPVQIMVPSSDPKRGKIPLWVVNVDIEPPRTPPQLLPNTDITGYTYERCGPGLPAAARSPLPGSAELTPMGIDTAAMVAAGLHERGKGFDDVVRYIDSVDKGDMVKGKQPPEWPIAAVEWCRRFCRQFPKVKEAGSGFIETVKRSWAPPPQPTVTSASAKIEVVNQSTGEVTQVDPHQPLAMRQASDASPISEDDIPF